MTELLKRGYFTLKKKGYSSILCRLKEGNAILATLANQNSQLEPARRSRSQTKLAILIRGLSKGKFSALGCVMACKCCPSHHVGLQMEPRSKVIVPNEEEGFAARSLEFTLAIGMHPSSDYQRWDKIRIRHIDQPILPSTSTPYSPSPGHPATRKNKAWGAVVFLNCD